MSSSDRPIPSIVQKAAAVLSDELKGGTTPSADSFGDLSLSGPTDFEGTVDRLRQQAGKLVDTLLSALQNRPERVVEIASQIAALRETSDGDNSRRVLLLKPPPPVTPGQATRPIVLELINDDPSESIDGVLYATDLVGTSGQRIPAGQVHVSPKRIPIPAGGSAEVQMEIGVPHGTQPGSYVGLLRTDDADLLQAVVKISVVS